MGQQGGPRILLRLDDGSIIAERRSLRLEGDSGFVRVDVERAFELGKLGQGQVLRAQQMVLCMESLLHGDSWVEETQGANKRKLEFPQVQDFGANGLKRLRSGVVGGLHGHDGAGRLAVSPSTASQLSWGVGEFEDKCKAIVTAIMDELGFQAALFANPVDRNVVRDYYKIIKKPMDLGTILGKLHRRSYRNPSEFYDDCCLVWSNCAMYNPKGSEVAKAGMRGDAILQRLWAASGLCPAARSRRQNAGVAAERFEPPALLPPQKKAATGSKAPRAAASKGAAAKGGKMERLQSTDNFSARTMTHEQMQSLATTLAELEGAALEGAIAIIREGSDAQGGDGEDIELDFDVLDPATLWKLHSYVATATAAAGAAPAGGGAAGGNGAFQIDGSDSDSGSESDSE